MITVLVLTYLLSFFLRLRYGVWRTLCRSLQTKNDSMYYGERFNAYTHLIGAMLAVAALVLMIIKGMIHIGLPARLLMVFACLCCIWAPTLYHSIPQPKN